MLNIFVEQPYKFVPPYRWTVGSWIGRLVSVHKHLLWRMEGVAGSEVLGAEHLKESRAAGHSSMLAPNQSRTADPVAFGFLREKVGCHYYAMASWHLFNLGWIMKAFIRSQGAFSVNREGLDRKAVQMSIDLLTEGKRLFVLFPEGSTSRTNDVLRPFIGGFDFIARSAAKKRFKKDGGKTVIHPIGFKYCYQGDSEKDCLKIVAKIEEHFSWRPDPTVPLLKRLERISETTQTLREIEFLGEPRKGERKQRVDFLKETILKELENKWLNEDKQAEASTESTSIRIKNLRQIIFPELTTGTLNHGQKEDRRIDLRKTYYADQFDTDPIE